MNLTLDTLPDWQDNAGCLASDVDPAWFFADRREHEATRRAKAICTHRCPIARACLYRALDEERDTPPETWEGIRGGLTADERRAAMRGAA